MSQLLNRRYQQQTFLGRGAVARVYAAIDTTKGTPCALKIFRRNTKRFFDNELFVSRLINELPETAGVPSLSHIVDYFVFFDESGPRSGGSTKSSKQYNNNRD